VALNERLISWVSSVTRPDTAEEILLAICRKRLPVKRLSARWRTKYRACRMRRLLLDFADGVERRRLRDEDGVTRGERAGGTITHALHIVNSGGEGKTAANVQLYDPLPPDTTFVSLTQDTGPPPTRARHRRSTGRGW
jgi:uncharacterized repeat protein (TIGR01451 family)